MTLWALGGTGFCMSKSYALAVHQLQTTLARATGLSTHILLERARADASDGPHRRSAATDHVRVLFEPLHIWRSWTSKSNAAYTSMIVWWPPVMRRTSRTRMDAIRHRLNTEQPIFLLSCVDQHILEGMFTCAPCKRLDHLNLLKRNGSVHTGRRTVSSLHPWERYNWRLSRLLGLRRRSSLRIVLSSLVYGFASYASIVRTVLIVSDLPSSIAELSTLASSLYSCVTFAVKSWNNQSEDHDRARAELRQSSRITTTTTQGSGRHCLLYQDGSSPSRSNDVDDTKNERWCYSALTSQNTTPA